MDRIGLIAGSDELPLVFADEAAKDGKSVVAVAFKGYTSPKIDSKAKTYWLDSINIGEVLDILRKEQIKSVAMEGKIPHSILLSGNNIGTGTAAMLGRVKDFQTQTVLKRAAGFLEGLGIAVMDARTYLSPVLCPEGSLTKRQATDAEKADIEFGVRILSEIGSADIGQLVAVKNRVVIAVEAVEGTDEAIKRGALLGGDGVVIVKMSKPGQDMRFDLPVIGIGTLKTMADCGVSVLAVESKKTVVLNKSTVIDFADNLGITISGV
jgi:UDP-2,3-diacylglucosamine hydrolase